MEELGDEMGAALDRSPQRLKPDSSLVSDGTAEAVPLRFLPGLKPRDGGGVYGTAEAVPLRFLLGVRCMVGLRCIAGRKFVAEVRLVVGLAVMCCGLAMMSGCGYHTVGAAAHVPGNVRTLAVPIFVSKVQAFHTETAFTRAVVRELNTRTSYKVMTSSDGSDTDAVLRGTILTETVAPLTYDSSSGQTSSYLVSVTVRVQLVARDGTVLYTNDGFAWREEYQSTQDLSGFEQEDGAAVRRMGRDFAEAVVSDMLESFQ